MSRSRLDEIVEAEFLFDEVARIGGKRIAEAAFRHGVEQAMACFLPESGYGHLIQPAVAGSQQPAPAAEKHIFHREDLNKHVGTGVCCDRRVGQRRRGQECTRPRVCEHAPPTTEDRAYHILGCDDTWHLDRRSRDRRTPKG